MDGSIGQILKLLRQNSGDNARMQQLLEELLNFEMENPGWYSDQYKQILDKTFKGGKKL